jgi:hypothetical protein
LLKLISPEHQRAETKPGSGPEEKPNAPERLELLLKDIGA